MKTPGRRNVKECPTQVSQTLLRGVASGMSEKREQNHKTGVNIIVGCVHCVVLTKVCTLSCARLGLGSATLSEVSCGTEFAKNPTLHVGFMSAPRNVGSGQVYYIRCTTLAYTRIDSHTQVFGSYCLLLPAIVSPLQRLSTTAT